MDNHDNERTPFLKVLRFGVCPRCLQFGAIDECTASGTMVHYHSTNPKCEEYGKDIATPIEIFDVLYYLQQHQPVSFD